MWDLVWGTGAGQGPARSLLCLILRPRGWLNPLWSLDPGTSGLLWVESRVMSWEYQKPLFCPLQLLEMSFNCLEDVESTFQSAFALSCESQAPFLCLPVPTRPRPAHRYQHV